MKMKLAHLGFQAHPTISPIITANQTGTRHITTSIRVSTTACLWKTWDMLPDSAWNSIFIRTDTKLPLKSIQSQFFQGEQKNSCVLLKSRSCLHILYRWPVCSHWKRPSRNLLGAISKPMWWMWIRIKMRLKDPVERKPPRRQSGISRLTDGKDGDFNSSFVVRWIWPLF